MEGCKHRLEDCRNLVPKTSRIGKFTGQKFLGCKEYPLCTYLIPLHLDEENITDNQKKISKAFWLFVRSNSFMAATFGAVYFNLREVNLLDSLLRSDLILPTDGVEVGLTKAKIYYQLFYYLFLIPSPEIKLYLINNFPKTYSYFLVDDPKNRYFIEGIDNEKMVVNEDFFREYSNLDFIS